MLESIMVSVPDGTFSAYVARPARQPAPVVVVLQEIFGVNPDVRESADELAALGFIAICPDLFWRQAPGVQLSDKTDWDRASKLYQAYDLSQGETDIAAAVAFARTMEGSTGKVAVLGFCLGGLMAFLASARSKVDATVCYYGGRTEEYLSEAGNLSAPLLMHLGEEDEYISLTARTAIEDALRDKADTEVCLYPGCAHAFTRHRGTKYDEAATRLASSRTGKFLSEHLKVRGISTVAAAS